MKKLILILLTAALIFSLTACAGEVYSAPESGNNDNNTPINNSDATQDDYQKIDPQLTEKLKQADENDLIVVIINLNYESYQPEINRILLEEHGMNSEYYLGAEAHSDWEKNPETGEMTRTYITKCGDIITQEDISAFHDIQIPIYESVMTAAYAAFVEQHIAPERLIYERTHNRSLVVEATPADIKKFAAMDIIAQISEVGYSYTGNVRIISNQTEYKPFENWNHGYGGGMSASGSAMRPEHVLGLADGYSEYNTRGQILPDVIYADDFELIIDTELIRNGVFIFDYKREGSFTLYKNEYTVETIPPEYDWDIPRDVYTFTKVTEGDIDNPDKLYERLSALESGEYILRIGIWWHGEDAGSSLDYHFKIIV